MKLYEIEKPLSNTRVVFSELSSALTYAEEVIVPDSLKSWLHNNSAHLKGAVRKAWINKRIRRAALDWVMEVKLPDLDVFSIPQYLRKGDTA